MSLVFAEQLAQHLLGEGEVFDLLFGEHLGFAEELPFGRGSSSSSASRRRLFTRSRSRPGARRMRSIERKISTFSGSLSRAFSSALSASVES